MGSSNVAPVLRVGVEGQGEVLAVPQKYTTETPGSAGRISYVTYRNNKLRC
jgi:hypothetical protein